MLKWLNCASLICGRHKAVEVLLACSVRKRKLICSRKQVSGNIEAARRLAMAYRFLYKSEPAGDLWEVSCWQDNCCFKVKIIQKQKNETISTLSTDGDPTDQDCLQSEWIP